MKKIIQLLTISMTVLCFSSEAVEKKPDHSQEISGQNIVSFRAPKGWKAVEQDQLSPSVKTMYVGTGKGEFPPSISLAVEPYEGTLKDYLKIVKRINEQENTEWKNLGRIRTSAGSASLSQYDENSNWGVTRTMTTIFVKNGNAYILSATALKSEFSGHYKEFFAAMRSLDLSVSKL